MYKTRIGMENKGSIYWDINKYLYSNKYPHTSDVEGEW